MKGVSTRRVAVVAALAACALTVGPLTSQASALVPTKTVAHSLIVDLRTSSLHGTLPLRPSAHVTRRDTGEAVAGKVVQFYAGGALAPTSKLCAVRTNGAGYAQCEGLIRLGNLFFGEYLAVFQKQGDFAKSQDTGQLLTIGTLSVPNN